MNRFSKKELEKKWLNRLNETGKPDQTVFAESRRCIFRPFCSNFLFIFTIVGLVNIRVKILKRWHTVSVSYASHFSSQKWNISLKFIRLNQVFFGAQVLTSDANGRQGNQFVYCWPPIAVRLPVIFLALFQENILYDTSQLDRTVLSFGSE